LHEDDGIVQSWLAEGQRASLGNAFQQHPKSRAIPDLVASNVTE
jgi:hypothetical protein